MSKGNLLLGFGRGKVGDLVFSRQDGEQVTRARNRSPRNPRTAVQLLQRVIMKTNSTAYSLLQEICNHSFQGLAEGTENQSRFAVLNVQMLRSRVASVLESGDAASILESDLANFSAKGFSLAEINPYIISEGTIPSLLVRLVTDATPGPEGEAKPAFSVIGSGLTATSTYLQVCDALGLQQGDQLTFIQLSADDSGDNDAESWFNGFRYARVILDPSDGDMSSAFLTDGVVNKPNSRNEGSVTLSVKSGALSFMMPGISGTKGLVNTLMGAAVIASRLNGGIWQRSTQQLVIRPSSGSIATNMEHLTHFLGDAVYSFMDGVSSSLYLNQAR